MYQALHTREHILTLPAHPGSGGPITGYLAIPVHRAGSILRIAIEADDRTFECDLLTGSSAVDSEVYPMEDEAYAILSADVTDGQHYSQYGQGEVLFVTPPNLPSTLNTTLWAKVSFDSASPLEALDFRLKLDTMIVASM